MKETFKKVFPGVRSLEHKEVPVVKEKVETMNFNRYKYANEKKKIVKEEIKRISRINKVGKKRCSKWNSVKHFARDCTSSNSNINTVLNSDQVHLTLFNADTRHRIVINDSNIKTS